MTTLLDKIKGAAQQTWQKAKKPLAITSSLLVISAPASAQNLFYKILDNLHSKVEIGVSYGIQQNALNPAQPYIDSVNKDFVDKKYAPIENWKNITISNPTENPIEGEILYKLGWPTKSTKVGVVGRMSEAKFNSTYNETYLVGVNNSPYNITRTDNIGVKSTSRGIRAKTDLTNWLSVSASVKQDKYDISGNVNYTMKRPDTSPMYVQNRTADYSGTCEDISEELNFDINVTKNISFSFGVGQRNGNGQTKGQEVKTASSNPGMSWTRDYSPEFNFNSSYAKMSLCIKF